MASLRDWAVYWQARLVEAEAATRARRRRKAIHLLPAECPGEAEEAPTPKPPVRLIREVKE